MSDEIPSNKKTKTTLTKAHQILQRLQGRYGRIETPLHFSKPYELAIAVILSAQCTDERVNQVTPKLFQELPTLESFAKASLAKIEKLIHSTGFYRNKAKHIQGFARKILEDHGGEIPRSLEELTELPGFGRKTANVVLSEIHGIQEGIVVDTHVKRISYKLGLTKFQDPVKIEKDLIPLFPSESWRDVSLYFIFLGRETCIARRPKCAECILLDLCPSKET